ncbi:MAG: GNAT family N-acetyltransferase [Candidatus Magasanikbacteria bacterium]|jgi:GNAT superfamily N-acetyltransferase
MEFKKELRASQAIKITAVENDQVIGRASLYLIYNDLHAEPYGLLEDVFVEEHARGQGLGTKLTETIIAEAKERGCHKLIANSRYSRPEVHKMYEKIGFKDYGKEFKIEF